MANRKRRESQGDTAVLEKTKSKKPRRFKIYLHNDDYTPMDFVVMILMDVFHKDSMQAQKIMWTVHVSGIALCGVYPFSIAESKVDKVMELARREQYPLLCTMEAE